MKTRKSWREKMNNPSLPKIVDKGGRAMLLPSPPEVEAFIRRIPLGSVATITEIRDFLAAKYAVDLTCPLVTGIFIRLAAEAAEEDARAGKKRITPYWRVLKADGSLNPKFPGGAARQAERLRAEGQRIVSSGGRAPRVAL